MAETMWHGGNRITGELVLPRPAQPSSSSSRPSRPSRTHKQKRATNMTDGVDLVNRLRGWWNTDHEGDGRVKSKQRVADHGEVFTPSWLVDDMLDGVAHEAERIDSRFLEPACGSGNFLVPVLRRKLATVDRKYGRSDFERRHHALLSLMCVYGIELLADNVAECRHYLVQELVNYLGSGLDSDWIAAARGVVDVNIVHGDALAMTTMGGEPIAFPEWAYLGRGKFQRRDFRYDTLTQMSSFSADTLFGDAKLHDIFVPTTIYPQLTVTEIAI